MHAGKIHTKVFFSVSATTTFLCVYSIAVAAVEKGSAFLFFGRGAAAANNFYCWLSLVLVLLTTSVMKQRGVQATISSF